MARALDRDGVTGIAAAVEVTVSRVTDFAALEAKWRDLESRADCSFFQSWTWTGCLAKERFSDPMLVEARESGRTVALGLFNRRGRTWYLGQSGDPGLDCIYVEFNGVLAESGREFDLTVACLRAARGRRSVLGCRRLVLSGVMAVTAAAAAETGYVRYNRSLATPSVDLTDRNACFLGRRSANTRQQLRRSDRDYARAGGIVIDRAETTSQAEEFLNELAVLHQASWIARGQPGAFAQTFFGRFHRALIARGLARDEIDLFRVVAATRTIGLLYNFRYRGHSLAYQSGFDYAGAGRHEKPGLTCHHQAIRFARSWGAVRYEFLAGDARYKRSLSDGVETLHWIEVTDRIAPGYLIRGVRDFLLGRGRRGLRRRPERDMNC